MSRAQEQSAPSFVSWGLCTKLAGEQVDVYANGQCIARGDVVVVEDSFAVRITEIVKNPDFKLIGAEG